MTRVKGAKIALKRRNNILKRVKGFKWGRKNKEKQAKEALMHSGERAFNDRRKKKGNFRRLWQIRINSAVRPYNYSYSRFIKILKDKEIALNRKVLSTIAKDKPESFKRIMKQVSSK